ncbi:hypothetical protein [Actinacidiphila sp. bgisy144]|uniref:hypothetical protein n=1 Tax=Actinacidiphila sp. bgisy144 TaxID=3413791 RepID=UPI003EBD59D3
MTSAASRPVSGSALDALRYRLRRLHRDSGEPSFRVVSQRTEKAISHTTAGNVLRCDIPPGWGALELVVEALGGDVEEFRKLWVAVRDEASPLTLPQPAAWEEEAEEAEEPTATAELSIPDLDAAEEDLQDQAARRGHREGEARRELLVALETRADLADRLVALHEQLGRERGRNEELRRRVADLETELHGHTDRVERLQDELRAVQDERLILLEKLNGLHSRRSELYFTWAREEENRRRAAETGHEEARREQDREVQDLRERLSAAEDLLRSVVASQYEDAQSAAEPHRTEEDTPRTEWRFWRCSRKAR